MRREELLRRFERTIVRQETRLALLEGQVKTGRATVAALREIAKRLQRSRQP